MLQLACLAHLGTWFELNLPVIVADAAAFDLTVTFGYLEMLTSFLRQRHVLNFLYEAILEDFVENFEADCLCFLLSLYFLFQTIWHQAMGHLSKVSFKQALQSDLLSLLLHATLIVSLENSDSSLAIDHLCDHQLSCLVEFTALFQRLLSLHGLFTSLLFFFFGSALMDWAELGLPSRLCVASSFLLHRFRMSCRLSASWCSKLASCRCRSLRLERYSFIVLLLADRPSSSRRRTYKLSGRSGGSHRSKAVICYCLCFA